MAIDGPRDKRPVKTIRRRTSRKPTGKWARFVVELRRRAYGIDDGGDPVCTQQEFAEALRVSPITVSRWELGKQDPPPNERARLALAAENLGVGMDLILAFQLDKEPDYGLRKTDIAITGLLRCLFLLRRSRMGEPEAAELHRIAAAVFDLSRVVTSAAIASRSDASPDRLVTDEMVRLLKEIDQDERSPFGQMARLFGGKTYTEAKKEELNDGR
ncbi:MAG TPA: helix-turn-helix transcriptional regulator [Bryobacteraceae bacterium]|nr:helix-turn-helix transcriptional regulator [Bryobacteraceae bacterium]